MLEPWTPEEWRRDSMIETSTAREILTKARSELVVMLMDYDSMFQTEEDCNQNLLIQEIDKLIEKASGQREWEG